MRRIVPALVFAAMLLTGPAVAQDRCTYQACPREEILADDRAARIEAAVAEVVEAVRQAADWREEAVIEQKTWVATANAYRKEGVAHIGYNPLWVGRYVDQGAWGVWPLRAVVAHEVAHHALGHTGPVPRGIDRLSLELDADAMAGYVLHDLGATRHEAQILWRNFDHEASETHPAQPDRLAAVARGWDAADGMRPPRDALLNSGLRSGPTDRR